MRLEQGEAGEYGYICPAEGRTPERRRSFFFFPAVGFSCDGPDKIFTIPGWREFWLRSYARGLARSLFFGWSVLFFFIVSLFVYAGSYGGLRMESQTDESKNT